MLFRSIGTEVKVSNPKFLNLTSTGVCIPDIIVEVGVGFTKLNNPDSHGGAGATSTITGVLTLEQPNISILNFVLGLKVLLPGNADPVHSHTLDVLLV